MRQHNIVLTYYIRLHWTNEYFYVSFLHFKSPRIILITLLFAFGHHYFVDRAKLLNGLTFVIGREPVTNVRYKTRLERDEANGDELFIMTTPPAYCEFVFEHYVVTRTALRVWTREGPTRRQKIAFYSWTEDNVTRVRVHTPKIRCQSAKSWSWSRCESTRQTGT